MSNNKERQRERVKALFLQAAMDLVRTEGIAVLTTKKIGDAAGFSYATIYNYFDNFNALLCEAVEALNREVADAIRQAWRPDPGPALPGRLRSRILAFTSLMLDHLAGNTQLYYPFISTEIDFGYFKERDGHPFIHPAYVLVREEIASYRQSLCLDDDGVRILSDILSYVFHAKLHFFIRYQVPDNRTALEAELGEEICLILDRFAQGPARS